MKVSALLALCVLGRIQPGSFRMGSENDDASAYMKPMHKVWEWCEDSWSRYSADDQADPLVAAGGNRVYRGGGWWDGPDKIRMGKRVNKPADGGEVVCGFRVVRAVQ